MLTQFLQNQNRQFSTAVVAPHRNGLPEFDIRSSVAVVDGATLLRMFRSSNSRILCKSCGVGRKPAHSIALA
jgi:hypothetical protein